MMRRTLVAGLMVAASGCWAGQSLPSSVVGEWDDTLAGCLDPDSLNGVTITGGRVQFYEAGGDVRSITRLEGGSVEATADWADVNVEGPDGLPQAASKSIRLTPSADGTRLTMEMDGASWTAVRCPAT